MSLTALLLSGETFSAKCQTAPVLTIAPLGTNEYSITITNNIGSADYDLLWTPVLGNPDYPWIWAGVGTAGKTNYIVKMENYQQGFFLTHLDTNTIPLWEAANPNNPDVGILSVYIDSPTNTEVIQ